MGFLSGLVKIGGGLLNTSAKIAGKTATATGKAATWVGGKTLNLGKKIGTSKVFMKEASGKTVDRLSFVDKKFQEATGLAKKASDGTMKYKTLTAGGFAALTGGSMLISTGKAISGTSAQSSRGLVSVADNMDRFVSYDGSGFINNVDDVAGGDPAVLSDIVNHTFTSQRDILNSNSLNDIVFALHANREG